MVEGFCKVFYEDEIDVSSAGADINKIDPTTSEIITDFKLSL